MNVKSDFREVRKTAFEKYKETPVRDRKHGLHIKTKLDFLNLEEIEVNEEQTIKIEQEELEKQGKVKLLTGNQIENSDLPGIDKVKQHLFEYFKNFPKEKEKIEYLHEAVSKVNLIYIKPEVSTKETIFIRNQLKENCFNHNFIYIGKHSNVNVFYETNNEGEGIGTDYTQVLLDEGAKATVVNCKDLTNDYFLYSKNLNITEKDSDLQLVTSDFGGKMIINESRVKLNGNNSKTNTNNIYYTVNGERYDLSCTSEHEGKHTYSLLNAKGAAKSSKALVRGLVKINKYAEESDGYQQSDALLMDEKAHVTSIPDLEIQNEKVRCSHGSTLSRLEEDKIFYIQSRGMDKTEAERQLVLGFFHPAIEQIPSEEVRNILQEKLLERIRK